MKFNEEVQAMLDDDGDVVGANGVFYGFSKTDFIEYWEIANTPKVGALLKRYGKLYRLIKDMDGTYAVLNVETFVEQFKGITEENLMHDLRCYGFDIVTTHKIN